jgi:hypothetical protein
MGGFPGGPGAAPNPSNLPEDLRKNLTVGLRDGGLLRFYGIFRGDLDFASARFNDVQNPFFVLPNDARFRVGTLNVPIEPNDANYSLYPRLTRFGLEYFGRPIESFHHALLSGRAEIDFLTPGFPQNPESRELLRLRLAYAQVQVDDFIVVAGQDWDLIGPLVPTINDNTLLWNAGNLGDRRPQVKFLWHPDLGGGCWLQVQNALALADAINSVDLDGNGLRDNEASGIPGWHARLGLVLPSYGANSPIMVGVWGALAIDETAVGVGQSGQRSFRERAIGIDVRLPITPRLTFQGEAFTGRNLDDLRGGIAQGVNAVLGRTIESSGGWAELVGRPLDRYQVSVGLSIDHPVVGDVPANGRTKNFVWYVGNRFLVGNGLTFGADYQNWTTQYAGLRSGHASLVKFFLAQAF